MTSISSVNPSHTPSTGRSPKLQNFSDESQILQADVSHIGLDVEHEHKICDYLNQIQELRA
jgi:hypothetical protein